MTIPERIEQGAKDLEALRISLIFDEDISDAGFDPIATHEYLQAIGLMHAAENCLMKAVYLQRRAMADSPLRHK